MKKLIAMSVLLVSNFAFADQLCGKFTSYCGNGWCNRTITPTYCLNGGGTCHDGQGVRIVAETHEAMDELNALVDRGEGTRVCVQGSKDEDGTFHVRSAAQE
jgi:hypothetical protein